MQLIFAISIFKNGKIGESPIISRCTLSEIILSLPAYHLHLRYYEQCG
jgi:hypothetical protein